MTAPLASVLMAVADLALPRSRRAWGLAMRAELDQIDQPARQRAYAAGCMAAAMTERARDFETRFSIGLFAVGLATVVGGALHLLFGWRGVTILFGRRDLMLEAFLARPDAPADLAARYHAAMPLVIGCFLALGLTYLASAFMLFKRRFRAFLIASGVALLIAGLAVALQLSVVWTLSGVPSEFAPLIVSALGVPLLLLWSNGRHVQPGRR